MRGKTQKSTLLCPCSIVYAGNEACTGVIEAPESIAHAFETPFAQSRPTWAGLVSPQTGWDSPLWPRILANHRHSEALVTSRPLPRLTPGLLCVLRHSTPCPFATRLDLTALVGPLPLPQFEPIFNYFKTGQPRGTQLHEGTPTDQQRPQSSLKLSTQAAQATRGRGRHSVTRCETDSLVLLGLFRGFRALLLCLSRFAQRFLNNLDPHRLNHCESSLNEDVCLPLYG